MSNNIVETIKAIGGLPNTFWGILILAFSMYISVYHDTQVGYYFAGVGSTLLGINHITPPKKENPDAGNPTS
jgi:hypothetical protein